MSFDLASKTPTADEKKNFKERLQNLLKTAVQIELSTIPVTVVHQEMLHLALAGNIRTSIDAGPKLYALDVIPTYGDNNTILNSDIPLRLEKCGKGNLQCFLRIEAPYNPPVKLDTEQERADGEVLTQSYAMMSSDDTHILDTYHSIGEFYRDVEDMIVHSDSFIDFGNEDKQFSEAEMFSGLMVTIKDQPSAHKALKIIVDQGEGSVGVEEAHYQMFLDLYRRREDWTCWPVIASPKTEMYVGHPFIKSLSEAFNAAYCYLLITIEKTWQTSDLFSRRKLIGNLHAVMIDILTPLADVLVQQPISRGGTEIEHAAPTFEFYPTSKLAATDINAAAKELFVAIGTHIDEALKATTEEWKDTLKRVKFAVGRVPWL
ncbi:ferritin-like-domain-containing protein [Crucibulum laeve]|uniref:Ferritin-like-domain-containing protein n=1 Tax=Crucibulum laeve TaxID=68775 RepID=A0A5C3M0N2_9AGAR|nr:ferritin-like-domain-containing protein [Crucibulum laeve]